MTTHDTVDTETPDLTGLVRQPITLPADSKESPCLWTLSAKPERSVAEIAEGPQPDFTPDKVGIYVFEGTVQGQEQGSPRMLTLEVTAELPTAAFTGPSAADVQEVVEFDASASVDPYGGALEYHWTYIGKGAVSAKISTYYLKDNGRRMRRSFSDAGEYHIELRVRSEVGAWSESTRQTLAVSSHADTASTDPEKELTSVPEVSPAPVSEVSPVSEREPNEADADAEAPIPVAVVTGPDTVVSGTDVEFEASESSDPNEGKLEYHWAYVSLGGRRSKISAYYLTQQGRRMRRSFTTEGECDIELTVRNEAGVWSKPVRHRVVVASPHTSETPEDVRASAEPPPDPPTAVLKGPSTAVLGEVVDFDASESTDPMDGALQYYWVYLGPRGVRSRISDFYLKDNGTKLQRAFTTEGECDIELTVRSEAGSWSKPIRHRVVVTSPPERTSDESAEAGVPAEEPGDETVAASELPGSADTIVPEDR